MKQGRLMMAMYYITPYRPLEWSDWEKRLELSKTLRIDPDWYKDQLQKQWPNIEFYDPISKISVLLWRSPDLPVSFLHSNLYTVVLDDPDTAFFVWHRSIIPNEYQLFVWNESGEEDVVELDTGMTEEEFDRYLHHLD